MISPSRCIWPLPLSAFSTVPSLSFLMASFLISAVFLWPPLGSLLYVKPGSETQFGCGGGILEEVDEGDEDTGGVECEAGPASDD